VDSLGPDAPSALDQRVVEHRLVVVLAGDHDDLVPDARMDDPLVERRRAGRRQESLLDD
jgi:hypothetical protein